MPLVGVIRFKCNHTVPVVFTESEETLCESNCEDCDYPVNPEWVSTGEEVRKKRIDWHWSLRRFCLDNGFDGKDVSLMERGRKDPKMLVDFWCDYENND